MSKSYIMNGLMEKASAVRETSRKLTDIFLAVDDVARPGFSVRDTSLLRSVNLHVLH